MNHLDNRRAPVAAWLATLFTTGLLTARADSPSAKKPTGSEKGPTTVEVRFVGGGSLPVVVLDERLELGTPYGRLLIPVADVRRIEFGWRVAEDVARRIDAAVTDLGDASFKRRQAACEELAGLKERAYPALLKASRDNDLEVARRASGLLERLRRDLPAERLVMRPNDVVHTADSKITGRLTASALRVKTRPFGEQMLKLADVCSLGQPGAAEEKAPEAQPDPGTLTAMAAQVGKTFVFRVTGAPAGTVGVWGTGTYTVDSRLAVAAVHAGVLRSGQTGVVKVTMLGPVPAFQASVQNGISSTGYGQYPGYRIER